MRIFSFPDFDAYCRKQRWTDELLVKVVEDVERGLNDGDLGSNVVIRRVARKGVGSAGGYRIIVIFRIGERAFLVEAFAKNVRALRELAETLLAISDESLAMAFETRELREIVKGNK